MGLEVEDRPSESPFVERVYRSSSDGGGRMMSAASTHVELVFWEHRGQVSAAVRGPETRAAAAPVPEDATFFGIILALGASLPQLPVSRLVDGEIELPDTTHRTFRLMGTAFRRPDFNNAEAFVQRLVREDLLAVDPVVAATLRGEPPAVSARTVQRRFLAATGLSRESVRQIGRARTAAALIRDGVPVPDVVYELGYFDQPHLAHALTRYIGRTATQLKAADPAMELSLLYRP